MSIPETPMAGACPQCGSPVRPDQDWCLNCGAALQTQVAGAPGWRTPVAIAGVVLLLAAGALLVAFFELTDDADRTAAQPLPPPTVVPTGPTGPTGPTVPTGPTGPTGPVTTTGPTLTPTPATTGPTGATGPIARPTPFRPPTGASPTPGSSPATTTGESWPAGRSAWTVILFSGTSRADADRKAGEFRSRGKSVGVLRSDDYSSLRRGYWVVFSGQYDKREDAQRAAEGLRSTAPQAYARFVKP